MSDRRQLGTRINDSGELAEAWDEYKRDYENKSSAMRQLMRQGLGLDEAEAISTDDTTVRHPVDVWEQVINSLSVGAAVSVVSWLAVTAATLANVLPISNGVLVVSGIVVAGLSSTVFHLRANPPDNQNSPDE